MRKFSRKQNDLISATRAPKTRKAKGAAGGVPSVTDKAAQAKVWQHRLKRAWELFDYKSFDIFGHYPNYTFPGFRSTVGATLSTFLFFAIFLRVTTTGSDFITSTPVISENRLIFQRDLQTPFPVPKMGLVFKQTGWKPFYDPTYFRFRFQQGYSGRASNSSYEELEDATCSFVDVHGRIVEDEARCPAQPATIVGGFHDSRFDFVHVAMLRCHNGTDEDGKAQPGPCKSPAEIDALIWAGTVTVLIEQNDLDPTASQPTMSLVALKKQFRSYVHATYDMSFLVRYVTIQPRAFFDQYNPLANQEFVILDRVDTSYTDYRAEKVGKWNKADPTYVPQYAAWYVLLGEELIDQQRSWFSVFLLMQRWGASAVFFYIVFSVIASRWNHWRFNHQVKGLDLRDLTRDQFDAFGRLVDTSFQVPRELGQMAA